jgi:hypothetical protein
MASISSVGECPQARDRDEKLISWRPLPTGRGIGGCYSKQEEYVWPCIVIE